MLTDVDCFIDLRFSSLFCLNSHTIFFKLSHLFRCVLSHGTLKKVRYKYLAQFSRNRIVRNQWRDKTKTFFSKWRLVRNRVFMDLLCFFCAIVQRYRMYYFQVLQLCFKFLFIQLTSGYTHYLFKNCAKNTYIL